MHTMRRAVEGPQCLKRFAVKVGPRAEMPDAVSLARRLTTAPTDGEARHG